MTAEEIEKQIDEAVVERAIAQSEYEKACVKLTASGKRIQRVLGLIGKIDGCVIVGKYAVAEIEDPMFPSHGKRRQVMSVKKFEAPGIGTMPCEP